MRMTINGREQDFDAPLTVAALVEKLGWEPRKIAVERNLEIVPRSAHQTTLLQDGDRIEIVNFVGGG
jgi:thiamine biosynthesis protein ThiS